MASISGSVPDETWKKLVDLYPQNPIRGLAKFIERFSHIGSSERILLVMRETLKELEALHGQPFDSPEQLLAWVKGLKSVNIGEVSIPLRENQKKQIAALASHYKVTFAEQAKKQIQAALDQVLGNY